jgi:hypothetical protein
VLPRIIWRKGELHNDIARGDFLLRLRDKGLVSGDTILRHMNLDPDIENRNMVAEKIRAKNRQKEEANAIGTALGVPSVTPPALPGAVPEAPITLPQVLPTLGAPEGMEGEVLPEIETITPGPGRPPEEPEVMPEVPTGERAPIL